jgi:hypothetical protein
MGAPRKSLLRARVLPALPVAKAKWEEVFPKVFFVISIKNLDIASSDLYNSATR